MKNRPIEALIVLVILLLAVSCTPETSAPEVTATATRVAENLTPGPEATDVEDTPDVRRELLSTLLPAYLMNGDYQALESLMAEAFVIEYWESDSQTLTPAEALEQLRLNLLPDPMTYRFTKDRSLFPNLGDVDPAKAFGPQVKVVDLVYSEGWGADGLGEAILAIGLSLDGQYWPGMIYAPAGFGTDGELQDGILTYVNEQAGYAFDYPADWIVKGEPSPQSYIYAITLQSFRTGRGGPVPPDQAKLDFVTCNAADCPSLTELQAQLDEQVASGEVEILSEETWTLAGEIPAIRRQQIGEMGLEVASLVTQIDGRVLQVGGYGDFAAFDQIVRTLRPAPSQSPEAELTARLEVPHALSNGDYVPLTFTLTNNSDHSLYVLTWHTPLEGIANEIFHVQRDGQRIPYGGILASRGDPTPDSYVLLAAGESVSAEVDLAGSYDFSSNGTYTIDFLAPRVSHVARTEAEMARTLEDLGSVQMPSNQVTVQIGPGGISLNRVHPAQETLVRYFSLLSEGKYADAVELYGAGYEVLRDWNPDVDPDDLTKLFERGCLVNGLQCLPVKTVELLGTSGPNTYEFSVQFVNPDDSLFVLDPEGDWAEDDLPRSSFRYTVARTINGFVVQELPPPTP